MKNQNKGISLIVLVITIIVIIILAAAVILSINNNNPIENVKKAKEIHNQSVYQEELELYAINEYANNTSFSKDTLNIFDVKDIQNIITSMTDEDAKNYITWQGKLVKKDGNKYKDINGVNVTLFDGTLLNEDMVKFAKEVAKAGLLYNGGYISNCFRKTVGELKEDLPEGVKIIGSVGAFLNKEKGDSNPLGTNDQICDSNGNLLAKIVIFGDINGDGTINQTDGILLGNVLNKSNTNIKDSFYIIADADHNGVIDNNDVNIIEEEWKVASNTIIQNALPKKASKIIYED